MTGAAAAIVVALPILAVARGGTMHATVAGTDDVPALLPPKVTVGAGFVLVPRRTTLLPHGRYLPVSAKAKWLDVAVLRVASNPAKFGPAGPRHPQVGRVPFSARVRPRA